MSYKETLNLPKTKFPMKASLSQKEPEILKQWEKMDIYGMIRENSAGHPKFILHDGPPYANGHIHLGTCFNKILKDIIIKSKQMMGYDAPYVPGWDCHGLPIELQVDKELGAKKKELSKVIFRKKCRAYAEKFINIQRKEFKRLGVFGEWDNPYLTMNYSYEAAIARELGMFAENGGLYRSKKPIHWCCFCKTALAEAEVEYDDHESPSIYVSFPVIDDPCDISPALNGLDAEIVIWTTTPWTIPANLAVCVHPSFKYCAIRSGDRVMIVAEGCLESFTSIFDGAEYEVLDTFDAEKIIGKRCSHPLYERESVIIEGTHVTLEAGTGCVHTAPGHGREDYDVGIKNGLDVYSPVDDDGRFMDDVGEFAGRFVFDANKDIIKRLDEMGALLGNKAMSHSYPHCWRCKKPVIFRSTDQWFISMGHPELRQKALKAINDVIWVPYWGRDRIYGMIENRPDWCISRQRSWGVPITVLYCNQCGEVIKSRELFDKVVEFFEKKGADIWFEIPVEDIISEGTVCPSCGGKLFQKETDILDVWFDSGVSHAAVLEQRNYLGSPADLYLEGSDQHRGWFHSSLLTSIGTRGLPPYKNVLTHGFVVDGSGKKMSKSVGNVILPEEIIKEYGAEILRLWVSAEDYKGDIRISDEILKRLSDAYRRIRNTARFIIGNLFDFNPDTEMVSTDELLEIDRWALHRLQVLKDRFLKSYDDMDFHLIYHGLHNFCVVDMSSFYLDILKDRLYTSASDSKERKSAQTALFIIIRDMIAMIAPVLTFTSEEMWSFIPDFEGKTISVHLSDMPLPNEELRDNELGSRWDKVILLRSEVTKAIEDARNQKIVGHSLDSRVEIKLPEDMAGDIKGLIPDLREIFIVSFVELVNECHGVVYKSSLVPGLSIGVDAAKGEKCPRCWIITDVMADSDVYPDLCPRCANVMLNMNDNKL